MIYVDKAALRGGFCVSSTTIVQLKIHPGLGLLKVAKIDCSAHTLNEWANKTEVDSGKRVGLPRDVGEKMKALERENRELRQVNEILRKASAYFAMAELDHSLKR